MPSTLSLSRLVGRPVLRADGRRLGRVRDVVADVSGGVAEVAVTGVVVDGVVVDPRVLQGDPHPLRAGERDVGPWAGDPPGTLLLRRDLLDAPVVTTHPSRRGRVGEVVLAVDGTSVRVAGLHVGPAHVLARLLPGLPRRPRPLVPLDEAHVLSRRAHPAQLGADDSLVRTTDARSIADVVTRLPVQEARDVLAATEPRTGARAAALLHPHVRTRVAGGGARRTRRLHGWKLHRPRGRHRDV